jgi:hypothetical protein
MLMWEFSSQVKASLAGTARRLELLQKVILFGRSNLVLSLYYTMPILPWVTFKFLPGLPLRPFSFLILSKCVHPT